MERETSFSESIQAFVACFAVSYSKRCQCYIYFLKGVDLEPLEEGDALLLPKPEKEVTIKTETKVEDRFYILEELGKYVPVIIYTKI